MRPSRRTGSRCPSRRTRSGTATSRTSVQVSCTGIGYPTAGHRFNPAKLLLDPYARQIGRSPIWHDALYDEPLRNGGHGTPDSRDTVPWAPLGVVADPAVRRPAAPNTVVRDGHLRAARQGVHLASSRGTGPSAGYVSRAGVGADAASSPGGWGSRPWSCCRCTSMPPSGRWSTEG